MQVGEKLSAWRPVVPGVGEVLHAHFTEHVYPQHVHDHWTVMLVDAGAVSYGLDRRPHVTEPGALTVLPPGVPHDGRSVDPAGFDKRVVYLDDRWLPARLTDAARVAPSVVDAELVASVDRLHSLLAVPGDGLEAESRLVAIARRLQRRWGASEPARDRNDRSVARLLRDRLDADLVDPPSIGEVAAELGLSPGHVMRAFGREFATPPHRYVTSRRVDAARRLLLDGMRPADVAIEVGFYDQAHLTRHFRRMLGTPPGEFARSTA